MWRDCGTATTGSKSARSGEEGSVSRCGKFPNSLAGSSYLGMPYRWYSAAWAPQQTYCAEVTFSCAQSMIPRSSSQYVTCSKGSSSTAAPVTISASKRRSATSSCVR